MEWGPSVLYNCHEFRIEEYLDLIPMAIFEMRNPYYLQQIIHKLVQFEHNQRLNDCLLEYFGG